ncbi:alpha/beta hydrolase [Kutzneria kofuensis]|uniref:Enterochelin esterase-like enzyme n=1 Tax=Kutzneria kofuensis TaxID=103725 RepID=A0A7W9NMT3_9PSEU|nr:alpha/beta hydrolase-fold protein [Kutzneria kofuensis]MBB5897876.1 enterochelin esterase-like enzyme [Kutzneria kofuensis]
MSASDVTVPDDVADHARQVGPLESPWIWLTLGVLAAVALAATVWFRRRRRARRIGTAVVVCLSLLAGITGLNSYVGYVRTRHDLAMLLERGGGPLRTLGEAVDSGDERGSADVGNPADPNAPTVDRIDIADPAHAVPSGRTFVLLPPGYDAPANANRRYPVVYLVHGYPYGSPDDWLSAGDAPGTLRGLYQHHALSPTIVVSVDLTAGNASRAWDGLDVPGGPQLETYLARTVVPTVDHRYRTSADRDHRALGGMSGGGFAALNIGLHHLDEFGALLISLPYDTLDGNEGLLGGNRNLVTANTPREYLPTMPFPHKVSVMLTAGTGAPTDAATANRVAAALQARGQNVVVRMERGFNHTWHTARASLPYLLTFAGRMFDQASPR